MAGFNYTAGAFFTFFLFVYGTFMGQSGLLRSSRPT